MLLNVKPRKELYQWFRTKIPTENITDQQEALLQLATDMAVDLQESFEKYNRDIFDADIAELLTDMNYRLATATIRVAKFAGVEIDTKDTKFWYT